MNCQELGIEATGVSADLQFYVSARYLAVREIAATLQSTWDEIYFFRIGMFGRVANSALFNFSNA